MGDGTLNRSGKSANIKVECVESKYLDYLSCVFDHYSRDVWLSRTAEESAEQSKSSGFNEDPNIENHSDVWCFETRQTPKLNPYRSWYETGRKVFPENIDLTPTVLKHWFVGDGTFNDYGSNFYIYISTTNEAENKHKIESYFEGKPLDIDRWETYNRSTFIRFNKDNTEKFFRYIGDPVPGYEYKWPDN